jgi:hypothetical protein
MVFHGAKCRHCRSNMSEPKLVTEGPKKGWYRTYCISCGHIEFEAPAGGVQQQQQPQMRPAMPTPLSSPRPIPNSMFQPILVKRPPTH